MIRNIPGDIDFQINAVQKQNILSIISNFRCVSAWKSQHSKTLAER